MMATKPTVAEAQLVVDLWQVSHCAGGLPPWWLAPGQVWNAGGAVYVRVAAAATGKPIGGIEAAADSANTIVLAHCEFTGAQDSQGNGEIRVFIGPQ